MRSKKPFIYVGIIIAIGIVFIAWGRYGTEGSSAHTWKDTDVACLVGGHQNVETHIHPELTIEVDGDQQRIPANVGINESCMAEVHTHDASGRLHIETQDQARLNELTLANFFAVWDKSFERGGYEETLRVNGEEYNTPEEVGFADGDQIEIRYQSATTSATSSADTAATTSDTVE